jgi:hypothetical protein
MNPIGDNSDDRPSANQRLCPVIAKNPVNDQQVKAEDSAIEYRTSMALLMFEARRLRSQLFDPCVLAGEGAWDIMLALYVAELRGRPRTRESLLSEVDVPPSVLNRWLVHLHRAGLVRTNSAASAVRFSAITLTDASRAQLENYFDSVAKSAHGTRGIEC